MRITKVLGISRLIIGATWHYAGGFASVLGPSQKELRQKPMRNCRGSDPGAGKLEVLRGEERHQCVAEGDMPQAGGVPTA